MSFITTHSGHQFDLLNPHRNNVYIEDIAHSLSGICRFNAHIEPIYSVAQHSVIVSEMVPDPFKLAGLMHDGGEAYYGDVTSPLKQLLGEAFRRIAEPIDRVVCEAFGLAYPFDECIHDADKMLQSMEANQMLPGAPHKWAAPVVGKRIEPWSRDLAKYRFLERFRELASKRTRHLAGANV